MAESTSTDKEAKAAFSLVNYEGDTDHDSSADDDDSITVVKDLAPVKIKEERERSSERNDKDAGCSSKGDTKRDFRPMEIKQEKIDKLPDWWTQELTDLRKEVKKIRKRYQRNKTERTIKDYREIQSKYKKLKIRTQPNNWNTREIREVKVVTKEDKEKEERQKLKNEKRKKMLANFDFEGKPAPTQNERKTWGYTKTKEWLKYCRKEKQKEKDRRYREQRDRQRELPNGRANLFNYP